MATQAAAMRAVENMLGAYATLLPVLPFIARAAAAEREAPGYGAKAVVLDLIAEELDRVGQ